MVEKIIIDGTDGNQHELYEDDSDSADGEHEGDFDEFDHPRFPWSIAMKRVQEFPNLRAAELWMQDECYEWDCMGGSCEQEPEYRQLYQNRFFEALRNAKSLDCLTLKNVQDAIITDTGSEEAIEVVRSRLKQLHLMVATEECAAAPEHKVDKEELHQCFSSLLKMHWLEQLQDHLTHLTVYCDTYWGVFPFMDLRGIRFPNLLSLALGNWSIAHDWQFRWIISHGETLEELILDDVCIVYAMWMPPEMVEANWPDMNPNRDDYTIKQYATRWNEVLPKFQKHLRKLRRFGMGHGDWHNNMFECRYELPARIESTRYMTYYHGIGPSQWTEHLYKDYYRGGIEHELDCEELADDQDMKDEKALNELLKAIGTSQTRIEEMKELAWDWDKKRWSLDC